MKILERIVEDIKKGENLDLYVSVAVAFILAVLNIFSLAPQPLLASVTLIVLGSLAMAGLGYRYRLDAILQGMDPSRSSVVGEYPENYKEDIDHAKELWMAGVSLGRTVPTFYSVLERKVKKGDTLKFLLVQPNSTSSKIAASRVYRPINDTQLSNKIQEVLSNLCELKKLAPDHVHIKTIDYPLHFGFFGIDINSRDGTLYVEYYNYKIGDDFPRLALQARTNGELFLKYREEIEKLWGGAQDWTF